MLVRVLYLVALLSAALGGLNGLIGWMSAASAPQQAAAAAMACASAVVPYVMARAVEGMQRLDDRAKVALLADAVRRP